MYWQPVVQPGESRDRARRAHADGAELRQGPDFPYDSGARSGGHVLRRLHRDFARGAGCAATGKVTQKVPPDFPGAEHVSTR